MANPLINSGDAVLVVYNATQRKVHMTPKPIL